MAKFGENAEGRPFYENDRGDRAYFWGSRTLVVEPGLGGKALLDFPGAWLDELTARHKRWKEERDKEGERSQLHALESR